MGVDRCGLYPPPIRYDLHFHGADIDQRHHCHVSQSMEYRRSIYGNFLRLVLCGSSKFRRLTSRNILLALNTALLSYHRQEGSLPDLTLKSRKFPIANGPRGPLDALQMFISGPVRAEDSVSLVLGSALRQPCREMPAHDRSQSDPRHWLACCRRAVGCAVLHAAEAGEGLVVAKLLAGAGGVLLVSSAYPWCLFRPTSAQIKSQLLTC